MSRHISIAVKLMLVTMLIFGVLYPLAITGIAQVIFPHQANGSMIKAVNRVVGSELIGQMFTSPGYFQPRPSAAGNGYDPTASGGSNLGPTSRKLMDRIEADADGVVKDNPGLKAGGIPADMVTASASGLDPDISVANAYSQIPRVARERGLPEAEVRELVRSNIIDRQFGILGEPRVNVLKLNLALDDIRSMESR